MDWQVTRVTDLAGAQCFQRVIAAAFAEDLVGLPADPVEEVLARLTDDNPHQGQELWVARDRAAGSDVVAVSQLTFPGRENTDTMHGEVYVHPMARRRGHGGRMLDHARARAHAHGRRRMFFEVSAPLDPAAPPSPGQAFARALGSTMALGEVRRGLDVALLDGAMIAAHAGAVPDGYRLVRWVGPVPDTDLDDQVALKAAMSTDPPQGSRNRAAERWDGPRYRAYEASSIRQGRVRYSCAARHEGSGRLVAYTEIGVSRFAPAAAFQGDTLVTPAHRGHGLGLWIKAANLMHVRELAPDLGWLSTWNATENSFMIAIKEALGFRPRERWEEHVLTLARSEATAVAR